MTPAELRTLMGWPAEVPEDLLARHIDSAERALRPRLAAEPPAEGADGRQDWVDAVLWRAAASVVPTIHTFALTGAAKVGRMEGSVEWRFLGPEEARSLAEDLEARSEAALGRLIEAADETPLSGAFLSGV